jgi:hypothetical protein
MIRKDERYCPHPSKAWRLDSRALLIKKGNRHVDLLICRRTPVQPTRPPITFCAAEATRMTTYTRFCRREDFTRNSVRHRDLCRKWRAAVGLTQQSHPNRILFTRTAPPPLAQIEWVYGYGEYNTIRRTLDFSMHLINLLQLFIVHDLSE